MTKITTCFFDGIQYIRANYWSSDGRYSTKTFLTMGEAEGWLTTMKAKYP